MSQPTRTRVEEGIWQRGKALEVTYRDAQGIQRRRTVPNGGGILAARRLRTELTAKRDRGERDTDPRLTFGAAAERWLAGPVSEFGDSTRESYERAVRVHLRPRYGTRRLDSIDTEEVARLIRELRSQGYADATIEGILLPLRSVYQYAVRRLYWTGVNPVAGLERSEKPKKSKRQHAPVFPGDTLERTLACCVEPYRTLFTLMAYTGPRVSEVLALLWPELEIDDPDSAAVSYNFQLSRRGVRAPLKMDADSRTVQLPRGMAVVLKAYHLACGRPAEGYVFCENDGTPLDYRRVGRELRAAEVRTGCWPILDIEEKIPRGVIPSPHSFRHTFASRWIYADQSIPKLSRILGHKRITITLDTYVHEIQDAESRRETRELLEAAGPRMAAGMAAHGATPGLLPTTSPTPQSA
jgi:integrase